MKENQKLYKIAKAIYSKLLKILYNPTTKGTKNIPEQGPIIIVGNHKHAFDPIMVMSNTNRTIHYMAKESLFKGIHGKILESIGTIKIHRNKSNPIAIKEAEEILKQGGAVGIFPEGTRNRTNQELLKFRHGAVEIAKKTNTPIIPFAIKGDYKLFKKGLSIEFGKPINISHMEVEEANNYIRNEVLNILRK
jgi:1-acyl-sn-glycerol-3-phosphate acyltransferase